MRIDTICFLTIMALASSWLPAAEKPNIIFILADDLGYGDVRCFNPEGKIATPQLDRLAAEGMKFTDAHTSSSVCTPTRYGLLTGRYNWRSRLKNGVLGGLSPRLIEPGRLTVAEMLRQQGYFTAAVGKWHLGMDWPTKENGDGFRDDIEKGADGWRVDYSKKIGGGPTSVGFDSFFGISASLDMVPYTFIEDDHVTVIPTVDKAFPMLLGNDKKLTRKGPAAIDFEAENVLPTLLTQAEKLISARAAASKQGHPFFLYLPLVAPHTPIAPTSAWRNKSGLNPYADYVMQTDAAVGAVMSALEQNGISHDTMVFFTSDNGCSPEAQFQELKEKGHLPSGPFRGGKADIFEGGHRVPFVVRWPGKVKPGQASSQLICLNDFMATVAAITGATIPQEAAEDSESFLPCLLDATAKSSRTSLVHHSINGSFAIREAEWKLALCADSGGWSSPRPGSPAAKSLPPVQLYNITADISEKINVAQENPERVRKLTELLNAIKSGSRSKVSENK